MKNFNYDFRNSDGSSAEYVILQTGSMTTQTNASNKPPISKADNLSMVLQESDSVMSFRCYLDSINRGHFLDFWFACQGFKNFDRSDTHKLYQLTKVIYRAYVRSESPYAVPLKANTKKVIVDKLSDRNSFDQTIFDNAQLEIKEILSGEFLKNFLKSDFYRDVNNSNTNHRNQEQISDAPVSSCSSSGNIGKKLTNLKYVLASHSSDAIHDSKLSSDFTIASAFTAQNTATQANTNIGNNGSGTGSKERKNLSEVDPSAFAKVLNNRLEEICLERARFENMLRLVKSVPTESDTDDSSSSAISYLMRCQLGHTQGMSAVDNEFITSSTSTTTATNVIIPNSVSKPQTAYRSDDFAGSEVRDDHAQDILESHCSMIGVDFPRSRNGRRDSFESKCRRKKENDLGSTTSYDSGVATSLEQYSNLGFSGSVIENVLPWQKVVGYENSVNSHKYHHHHHHHHKNNFIVSKTQWPMQIPDYSLNVHKASRAPNNAVSDVSSNIDSGVSSTYEKLGRRFQSHDEKVTNWITNSSNVTSDGFYYCHDHKSNAISGIPPNTPLIQLRKYTSSPCENYCQSDVIQSKAINYSNIYPPLPESTVLSDKSLENWLEHQAAASVEAAVDNCFIQKTLMPTQNQYYCSSTIGAAGSDLQTSSESGQFKDNSRSVHLMTKETHSLKLSPQKPSGPLVIGYYIGSDPVPYRTQLPDTQNITLGQFKSIVAKKGNFRYFFKRYCDEFDGGVVHEEISKDETILPLWEGKVVAKIEKVD